MQPEDGARCPRCNSISRSGRAFVQDDDDSRTWGRCVHPWHDAVPQPTAPTCAVCGHIKEAHRTFPHYCSHCIDQVSSHDYEPGPSVGAPALESTPAPTDQFGKVKEFLENYDKPLRIRDGLHKIQICQFAEAYARTRAETAERAHQGQLQTMANAMRLANERAYAAEGRNRELESALAQMRAERDLAEKRADENWELFEQKGKHLRGAAQKELRRPKS